MIEERNRAYETLIRHTEAGGIAAHHQTISEVIRDGVVIAATVSVPVALIDVAAELEPIIGAALIAAVADADALREKLVQREAELAVVSQELAALKKAAGQG